MFRDREDAALQLAVRLKNHLWHDPLVLGIPRGGVVLGAVLARELNAGLDVVLARKLRAPNQPELALGAVSETGAVYLNDRDLEMTEDLQSYLAREIQLQKAEIERRKQLFRCGLSAAPITGRSVIVTDDGIATGSTMIAALKAVRGQQPRELVVAVPVASPRRLDEVAVWCDEVVCLISTDQFRAVGEFYKDFTQVEDEEVIELLHSCAQPAQGARV